MLCALFADYLITSGFDFAGLSVYNVVSMWVNSGIPKT
jgi:hypothetical protein